MDGNLCCMFPFIFAHVSMTSLKASTRKPKMHPAISLDQLTTSNRYQTTLFNAFSVLWPHSSMFQLLHKENWWKFVYRSACKTIGLVPAVGLWTGCACVCICLSYFLQLDCGQGVCVCVCVCVCICLSYFLQLYCGQGVRHKLCEIYWTDLLCDS
jgi:hypothetical protein